MYKLLLRLACLCALTLLVGCAQPAAVPTVAGGPRQVQVGATIFPLYDFARQIGAQRVELHLLAPPGGHVHSWEPSTADVLRLERLDVLLYNGAGLEHWVCSVLPALQNQQLIAVQTSAGLELLPAVHDCHTGHEHCHDHDHGPLDPHVWLSPARAAGQARAILYALIEADPEGEPFYRENFENLVRQLYGLHEEFYQALAPLPRRDIVVAHAAFGYLCHDFGLNQIAVQGFSPHTEPTPAGLAQVIGHVREREVSTIFFESGQGAAVAQAIARETGAAVAVLHPLESLTPQELAAGDDYFAVMRRNLEALTLALG